MPSATIIRFRGSPSDRAGAVRARQIDEWRTPFLESGPSDGDCISDVVRRCSTENTRAAEELAHHRPDGFLGRRAAPRDAALHSRRRELVHSQSRSCGFGKDHATRLADPQCRLHALAVKGLFDRQFVRKVARHELAKPFGENLQTGWQRRRSSAEAPFASREQPHVASARRPGAHDIAGTQRHRHGASARPRLADRDLETAVPDHVGARVDAQNPYHRHVAQCKVVAVKIAMLLLAAGRGSRFGGPVPKAFLTLAGRALVVASAARLVAAMQPGDEWQLLLVVHPEDREQHVTRWLPALREVVGGRGQMAIVDGGETRQESMQRALATVADDVDLVLVHDAARALLPVEATRECIAAASQVGAALLAVPASDTLKQVAADRVVGTVPRAGIWLAQTPQVIRRELLARALAHAASTGFAGTDDVSLVEHLGADVAIVRGTATNLKITEPGDLRLAEAILAGKLA
jgi:2-C-methyl-D-erythritol 4-phosphate cytidylyltransferase